MIAELQGEGPQWWRIRCRWDGSVLISLVLYPQTEDAPRLYSDAVFSDAVRVAADEALGLMRALGGVGPAHIVLNFEPGDFLLLPRDQIGVLPFPATTAQAWSDEPTLPDATLGRWEREFLRDAGFTVHEPDDD